MFVTFPERYTTVLEKKSQQVTTGLDGLPAFSHLFKMLHVPLWSFGFLSGFILAPRCIRKSKSGCFFPPKLQPHGLSPTYNARLCPNILRCQNSEPSKWTCGFLFKPSLLMRLRETPGTNSNKSRPRNICRSPRPRRKAALPL